MEWIQNIVVGLIETYNTRNVRELISLLGITIIRRELLDGKKARFFRDFLGNEFIFLSNSIDDWEENFILAHELGHAILHTNISCEYCYNSCVNSGKLEFQANYFATELLIDESIIDKQFLNGKSINQISTYFGIPESMISYKFKIAY